MDSDLFIQCSSKHIRPVVKCIYLLIYYSVFYNDKCIIYKVNTRLIYMLLFIEYTPHTQANVNLIIYFLFLKFFNVFYI